MSNSNLSDKLQNVDVTKISDKELEANIESAMAEIFKFIQSPNAPTQAEVASTAIISSFVSALAQVQQGREMKKIADVLSRVETLFVDNEPFEGEQTEGFPRLELVVDNTKTSEVPTPTQPPTFEDYPQTVLTPPPPTEDGSNASA